MDIVDIVDSIDDLRPYTDAEIPAAMRRMAADPTLSDMVGFAFPGVEVDEIRGKLLEVESADQFQSVFVQPMLENIVRKSSSGFTMGGVENIAKGEEGHLFVSDHRDIVLDGALLQLVLIYSGFPTSEITFGSNLISSPFVEDFGRSNKMYKIIRGGAGRDLVRNSRILSDHIHEVVADGRSIWISQRDGRTKDGNDKTDQGLVKMLTMGGGDDPVESLVKLHIVPFAISYEYESCDAMKAREIYLKRRGNYTKAPGEDLRSIINGVKQEKGAIHIQICPPILPEEIEAFAGQEGNEMLRGIASLIDGRIYEAYKLFPTNYIAYDIKKGVNVYENEEYTAEQREKFTEYLKDKVADIDGTEDELYDILLDIYAYPVINKLFIGNPGHIPYY